MSSATSLPPSMAPAVAALAFAAPTVLVVRTTASLSAPVIEHQLGVSTACSVTALTAVVAKVGRADGVQGREGEDAQTVTPEPVTEPARTAPVGQASAR